MDEQRKLGCATIDSLTKDSKKQQEASAFMLKESDEKVTALSNERDQLVKQRDSAFQEAHMWRSELAKAREQVVILEGAVVRAEEKVRVAEADAESRIKEGCTERISHHKREGGASCLCEYVRRTNSKMLNLE
ncbi:Pleckstrin-like (PH) domain protein [Quillaja saponaria]|uniref:Pleckstrin-like (PH) domain protein n=1 Tax=Quillaja saponaria TaxID=32244 RepID=A0AAD7PMH9_QUISA|nr:Pleckstrin-like (PH) domain protein [Quillaja saponaria]